MQVFAEFDHVPIGAASIGQVHRAVLKTGKDAGQEVRATRGLNVLLCAVVSYVSSTAFCVDPQSIRIPTFLIRPSSAIHHPP